MYLCTPKFGARFLLPANLYTCIYIYNKYMHIQRQIQRYHITKEVIGHDKRIPTVAALVIALLTDLFVTSDLARARAVGINEVAGEDLALGALAFVGCLSLVGGDCLMFIVLTCSIILVLVLTAFVAVFPNTNVYSLMPLQFHILYMSFFLLLLPLLLLLLLLLLLPCYWGPLCLRSPSLHSQWLQCAKENQTLFAWRLAIPSARPGMQEHAANLDTFERHGTPLRGCMTFATLVVTWLSQVFSLGSHFWIQFWEKSSFMLFLF